MSEQRLSEEQMASRRTLARWLFILGGLLLIFGLYLAAFMIPDFIKALSGPQSMSLEEAVQLAGEEQVYARLEDGEWDCDSVSYVEGFVRSYRRYEVVREETKFTEVLFTDEPREIVTLVTLSGEVNCDGLSGEVPSGYLYSMSDETREELSDDGRLRGYRSADHFLEFCGYCGRDNSLIGVIFSLVFTLCGAGMVVYGFKLRRSFAA